MCVSASGIVGSKVMASPLSAASSKTVPVETPTADVPDKIDSNDSDKSFTSGDEMLPFVPNSTVTDAGNSPSLSTA